MQCDFAMLRKDTLIVSLLEYSAVKGHKAYGGPITRSTSFQFGWVLTVTFLLHRNKKRVAHAHPQNSIISGFYPIEYSGYERISIKLIESTCRGVAVNRNGENKSLFLAAG